MKNTINRIKKSIWTFRQHLSYTPKSSNACISDLFVWRYSKKWKTYFELFDIPSLFSGKAENNYVDIVLFDSKGDFLVRKKINLHSNERNTICISDILKGLYQFEVEGDIGTFSIFHSHVPKKIKELKSYIAERGYVSYQYNNKPIRSYVHGNYDAISSHNKEMKMLGGRSFLKRKYRLQYIFNNKDELYEIGIVNTFEKKTKITYKVVSSKTEKLIEAITKTLPSKGIAIFPLKVNNNTPVRIIIESKLVMARPVVFSVNKDNLNIFHG